ncbi:MAG: ankyrin repeat domain-containing protein, partial [Spirochaetales bacterium]|nr:ankyrin repeat domain-containing protein [Spirochaetales bacterium]
LCILLGIKNGPWVAAYFRNGWQLSAEYAVRLYKRISIMRTSIIILFSILIIIPSFADLNDNLINAAIIGDLQKVKEAMKQGADVNAKSDTNRTALFLASGNGHTEVVKLLIETGADVNIADTVLESTAIHVAANMGYLEIVGLLIKNGADIDPVDKDGKTPLMLASLKGFHEIVRLLAEHGANTNHTDVQGYTSIMWAAFHSHTDTIVCLIELNADLNCVNVWHETVLDIVKLRNLIQIIDLLKKAGAQSGSEIE